MMFVMDLVFQAISAALFTVFVSLFQSFFGTAV